MVASAGPIPVGGLGMLRDAWGFPGSTWLKFKLGEERGGGENLTRLQPVMGWIKGRRGGGGRGG